MCPTDINDINAYNVLYASLLILLTVAAQGAAQPDCSTPTANCVECESKNELHDNDGMHFEL